ncbi:MAG: MaoC family dehydratase [Acidobacteriota bacterium]
MSWRFFEDIEVGEVRTGGEYRVDAEEILDFGRRFDPQPFHVDPEAAAASPFGGLVASGWHTSAVCMRLMVDLLGPDGGSEGSPGVEDLRWRTPVRPGDRLSVRVEVLDKRATGSRPTSGLVKIRSELLNQRGEIALSMTSYGFFRRRNEARGTKP